MTYSRYMVTLIPPRILCFLKLFTDLLKLQLLSATGHQSTKTLFGIPRVFSYLSFCEKMGKINTQFLTSLVKK